MVERILEDVGLTKKYVLGARATQYLVSPPDAIP